MVITGASGAIPRSDRNRMDRHASLYYEEIRKRNDDVKAISNNTGILIDEVQKIKEHIFSNKYSLGGVEPERFDADYDISISWQRLIEGNNIQDMDIVLLKHELIEYKLMNEKGLPYRDAHQKAELKFSYSRYIRELDRKEGIV